MSADINKTVQGKCTEWDETIDTR